MFRYRVCAIRNHPNSKEQICRNSNCCRVLLNYNFPANIHLDEDVLKMSSRRLSSSSSEDALIKANMFTLALRLQKTSSRHLQDVLVKTNIFVLAICLQDVFKTFSRRLQDVFKTSCQDVFKTFSRRLQDVLQERLQDILKAF